VRTAGDAIDLHRNASSAVAWAALAEAVVWALPVHVVVSGSEAFVAGQTAFVLVFAAFFTLGCVVVDRFRSAEPAVAVAVLAIVLGVLAGGGRLEHTIVTVVAFMLVGLRIVTLGLRDWSEPVGPSVVIGAAVLGLECLLATGTQPGWSGALVVVVPVFFGASLASRSATVWADRGPGRDGTGRGRLASPASIAVATGVIALGGLAIGGLIDGIGSWLAPIGRAAVILIVWIVSQLLRPLFWAFERAGLNPEGAQQLIDQIREQAERNQRAAAEQAAPASGSGVARVLAFLLLMGLVAVSIKLFRRIRARDQGIPRGHESVDAATVSSLPRPAPTRVATEPATDARPADAIRALYAEMMGAFAGHGIRKPPEATPAEFERMVAASLPAVGAHFEPITRAYESVRYGATIVPSETLRSLRVHRRALLAALRRSPESAPHEDDPD
jgi:hypothetical protein